MCDDFLFGDSGNDAGSLGNFDVPNEPVEDFGVDYTENNNYMQESIPDSILGLPADEYNAGGPPPQELYVNGRYLIVNLDGTVTTYDGQIVCTVDSSEVGSIMADDIRILIGVDKLK